MGYPPRSRRWPKRIHATAIDASPRGYPALLRRKYPINCKRVHRLWKRARVQVQRSNRRRQHRERPLPRDAFTREALAIAVDTSTSAERVIGVLLQLVAAHGTPTYLRSDNGSEFVAVVVQAWLAQRQIQPLYSDPGCPWQNGKDEQFNATVRDECLTMQRFASVVEAHVRLEALRRHYNQDRPHSRVRVSNAVGV